MAWSPDLDRFDVVVAGAPDTLGSAAIDALLYFVRTRAGRLVVLPDRRVPDAVSQRLGLPRTEEVLLPSPVTISAPGLSLRGSEFLVPLRSKAAVVASAVLAGAERPVLTSGGAGSGAIIYSGALDWWRYRGDASDLFWQSLVADAALAAPPPVTISAAPGLVRPGEQVAVRVTLRETLLKSLEGGIAVPPVEAEVTGEAGHRDVVRLWPSSRPGEFEGHVVLARTGTYFARVATGRHSAVAPVLVAEDVLHPQGPASTHVTEAVSLTGGAALADPAALRTRLMAVATPSERVAVHPMRSPWIIVPFGGLLCAEWALRRRKGLR